jgi:hypothetical protein
MPDLPLVPPDATADLAPLPDATLLGNVLTVGARLVAQGLLPPDVVEEAPGAYALCLVARDGASVRVLHVGDALEVGRAPSPDAPHWQIDDPWMSARHFTLSVTPDALPTLRALAPKNGLYVNDRPAAPLASLRRGDVLRAGTSSFLLL